MSLMVGNIRSGLGTIMMAGYANIARDFIQDIRRDPAILEFRILRPDGGEAFLDNNTIQEVNRRLGTEEFLPRDKERHIQILDESNPELAKVVSGGTVPPYQHREEGLAQVTF
ncbi:MAG: sensor domain-containing diguanylate cyclase, partial [Magnetococcales bacterium]|nr:sensor domain-containing diguanylate cyclase [Magnetococcales bacterium]